MSKRMVKNPLITTERIIEVLHKTTVKPPDKEKIIAELVEWLRSLRLTAPGYARQVREIIERNV